MNPLSVTRNDYHTNPKPSTIYTPVGVAQFLFDILDPAIRPSDLPLSQAFIFDPAIGTGRLTDPWYKAGYRILGCDVEIATESGDAIIRGRFEDCTWYEDWPTPDLVLCNPPFNGAPGKQLYPEVFLKHIFELFGTSIPAALFVPMGFRLNQRCKSKRWRWLRDCGAKITSIVSLPLDMFEEVEFHSEIVICNVRGLEPHYFLPEEAL